MPRPAYRRRPGSGRRLFFALIVLAVVGCGGPPTPLPPPPADEWFRNETDRLGVRFVHDPGDPTDYLMPRSIGSGVAVFDADGDGRQDLFFLQNAGPAAAAKNVLYRQRPDGTFEDVSAGSGLDFAGYNMGVAVGDVDGDGRPDVAVTQYRGVRLFLNRGGCRFEDVTAAAGLDNPMWGTSAAFFDYDRDGRLDLVVANYIDLNPSHTCESTALGGREFCGPSTFPDSPSKLFHNLGPAADRPVRFEDVSLASGIGKLAGPALGLYCGDLTGDGWPDVFVADDEKPNRLWVNRHDGTFADEAVARGLAFTGMGQAAANMGVAAGDVDGDGLTDLFVTHLTTESNTLWRQGPAGRFTDRTGATRAAATGWRGTGFGTLMADFDGDGRPDLAVVNGRIARGPNVAAHLPPFWQRYGERNQLLHNRGGEFVDVSAANPAFCGRENVARGLAVGDLNGDGRPDLVVTSVAGPARVFLNRATAGNWLAVQPLAAAGGAAVGAVVEVTAGGQTQTRTIQPGDSFLSSSQPTAFFGLGAGREYESLRVTWPDGRHTTHPGGPANRTVTQRQPPR